MESESDSQSEGLGLKKTKTDVKGNATLKLRLVTCEMLLMFTAPWGCVALGVQP